MVCKWSKELNVDVFIVGFVNDVCSRCVVEDFIVYVSSFGVVYDFVCEVGGRRFLYVFWRIDKNVVW